jgi:hypothetical protein
VAAEHALLRALPQRKVGVSDRWDLGEVVKVAMDSVVQPRVWGFGSGSDKRGFLFFLFY